MISHLDTYKVFGVISTAVTKESFVGLKSVPNLVESEDLISTLIGLDYIDKELYLTPNFNPREELLLPSKYSNDKSNIGKILSSAYFPIVNHIKVVPSLVIQVKAGVGTESGTIMISTPNPSSVKVSIRLAQTNANDKALFVKKTYSTVYSSVSDKSTNLIIEGTLADVNKALKNIVIDISDPKLSYNGELVVSDGMNPPIPKNISSLETFFRINEIPRLNKSIQHQLDQIPISTGEYFNIELDSETFWDVNDDSLEYYLVSPKEGEELPTWLSLKGLTLMGTPPEKWKTLEYNLVLVAKNEFKFIKVPFTLNVRISVLYGLKMVGSLVGSILTAIGTWYTINKIYNILAKKSYVHPKIFQVEVEKEITPQTIYPIGFIAEEIAESKFILKKVEEYVKKTFKLKNNKQMINFFIAHSGNLLNKTLILKTIEETISLLQPTVIKQKIQLYLPGINSRKEIIEQLIINELTLRYLNLSQDKATKEIFQKLKNKWPEIIEFNSSSKFVVNRAKLLNKLSKYNISKEVDDSKNSEEVPLINTKNNKVVNLELLEDAFLAYGFHYQNFNLHFLDVRIEFRQKAVKQTKLSFFKRFFKLNLKSNDFMDKGLCYSVYFKMEDNTLTFYGTPHRNLAGKTLVFQITNKRGKILRELWINGVLNEIFQPEVMKHEKDIL